MIETVVIALITFLGTILGAAISGFATVIAANAKGKNEGQGSVSCAVIGLGASFGAAGGLILGALFGLFLYQSLSGTSSQNPQVNYKPTAISDPYQEDEPSIMDTPISNANLASCESFQRGEKRLVPADTFVIGDIIINGVRQYDQGGVGESTVAFFENEATVTAPWGAGCYTGDKTFIEQVIEQELEYGCGSTCTSIRFVRLETDNNQAVKYYKK